MVKVMEDPQALLRLCYWVCDALPSSGRVLFVGLWQFILMVLHHYFHGSCIFALHVLAAVQELQCVLTLLFKFTALQMFLSVDCCHK